MDPLNPPPGAAGAAGTTPPPAGAAGSPPAAGEEYKAMTPDAFKARLEAERQAGIKAALKDLGVDSLDVAKTRLTEDAKRREAEKSELQRAQDTAKDLEPKAKRADALEASVKRFLEAEEKAIPDAKKSLLDLAPPATDPVGRLDWIANAKSKGLFGEAATTPANTRAGGNPPPASTTPGTAGKRPAEMTDAEYRAWRAERDAKVANQR